MLKEFSRRIALVFVELDRLPFEGSGEGRVLFRGSAVVILRAPATVQLHSSNFVERLPLDGNSYWNHLTSVNSQLNLPLIE